MGETGIQERGTVEEKSELVVGQHQGQSDQSGQEKKRNNDIQCLMG